MPNTAKLNLGLYFVAIIVLLIFALSSGNSDVDVHLHDTYLVFPNSYLFKAPAIFLIPITLLYMIARRITRITSLMFIHTLGTLGLIAWLLTLIYYPARSLTTVRSSELKSIVQRTNLIWVGVQILLWWQVLLPLNWIVSSRSR